MQRLAILQVPDFTSLTSGGVVAGRPPDSERNFYADVAPHDSSYEWIADTGATRSATFSEVGLYNETVCRVRVKGVGGEFVVTRTGLLDVKVLLDNGRVDSITISVLVHENFPLQLLSLRDLIAARGAFVFDTNDFHQIQDLRALERGRLHGKRKGDTKLYVLSQPENCFVGGPSRKIFSGTLKSPSDHKVVKSAWG